MTGVISPVGTAVPGGPAQATAASATPSPAFSQALSQALAAQGNAGATATAASSTAPSSAPSSARGITLGEMIGLEPARLGMGAPPAAAASVSAAGAATRSAQGMVLPAQGRVSSEFGPRVHPVTGQRRPHTGIDIAASTGSPIRAAAAGEVTFAGRRGGYGNMIIIDHGNGRETYYAHNSANHVRVGDRVEAGQHIGAIGATGTATGPHLHFEVRENGTPKQPRDYVNFGRGTGGPCTSCGGSH